MRKFIGTLVCLLVSFQLSAVSYQTMTYSAPETNFRSTSAYAGSYQPTGSLSAISASNFQTLNSEGGACYHPSAIAKPRRINREDMEDENGTGQVNWESPVGDIPFALMAFLALLYARSILSRRKHP